jgi:hypothetical protein
MFGVLGIIGLVVFIYLKPQEFIPQLERIPFLYLFLALAIFGVAVDVRSRLVRIEKGPHLYYVIAFYVWCMFTGAVKTGGTGLVGPAVQLSIALVLYLLISTAVQSFKALELLIATVVAASLFVGVVGFHQGFAPLGCAVEQGSSENLRPDGRPCQTSEDCYLGDAEPGASYQCERQGLFGTMSVGGGRVRYRGVLRDPNELALATGASIPLLIGRVDRKRSVLNTLLLVLATAMIAVVIIFTQSRGGQLVFLAALGAYFIRKFGTKGLVAGAIVALPILLLGGRSSTEASGSTTERTEIMVEGLTMLKENPILGVGFDQFTQHHFLTAHNSYLLPLSENGPLGLFLFACIVYVSIKIPVVALGRYKERPEARVALVWSMSLLATFAALCIGIFFLSFTYHHILWIYLGLSGALYKAIKTHDRDFEIDLGLYEYLGILVGIVVFTVGLFFYTKIKLG